MSIVRCIQCGKKTASPKCEGMLTHIRSDEDPLRQAICDKILLEEGKVLDVCKARSIGVDGGVGDQGAEGIFIYVR